MSAVYKKELKSYFSNMTGYIAIALILVMAGIFVKLINFQYGYPTMETVLPTVALILMLAVPIVTMKSFAEERHQKDLYKRQAENALNNILHKRQRRLS